MTAHPLPGSGEAGSPPGVEAAALSRTYPADVGLSAQDTKELERQETRERDVLIPGPGAKTQTHQSSQLYHMALDTVETCVHFGTHVPTI